MVKKTNIGEDHIGDGTELVGPLTSINEKRSDLVMIDDSKDHNYILKECPLTKQLELDNEKLKSERILLKKEIRDLKGQLFFYKKQNTRIKSIKEKLSETIAELREEIKTAKGPTGSVMTNRFFFN